MSPRAEPGVGCHEGQVAIEAMRHQHAIEWIAMAPVETPASFRVGGVDAEFDEAGVSGRRRFGAPALTLQSD